MIGIDHRVRISAGLGRKDRSTSDARRVETSLAELLEAAATLADRKGAHYWTPGYRMDAGPGEPYERRIATLERAELVGFDFDDGSPEQIRALLDSLARMGVAHLAHTSYSHRPGHARIRLALPLAEPIGADAYAETWRRIALWASEAHGLVADPAPSHIASVFYYGQPIGSPVPWVDGLPEDPGVARWAVFVPGRAVTPAPAPERPRAPQRSASAMRFGTLVTRPGRVAAYLAKVPATNSTPDLYALICRVGDLTIDEGEVTREIEAWAARTGPAHSTGIPYSERELADNIRDALRYRQNAIGGAA